MHNKSLQTDNLRGVCIVVSLSLHFTTMQTPHKLRLSEALERNKDMHTFPIQKIRFVEAVLSGEKGDMSIEITLSPFELTIDDYSESVDTSIRLDGIDISSEPIELEEKIFTFPVNPNPGYIDGSVYFLAAHNPVDVSKIEFGKIENGKMAIKLQSTWLLEFERTGYRDTEMEIKTEISL